MANTSQTKPTNVPPKSKTKSRINKRLRNRRRNKQKMLNGNGNPNKNQSQSQTHHRNRERDFSQRAYTKGAEVWNEAYLNAVRWHGEHQNNFWRHAAEQLEIENQMLRQQLHYVANTKPSSSSSAATQLQYETSDEEEEKISIVIKTEEDEIDSKYLEFMQITIQHREELRLKREAADLLEEEEEDSTAGTID